MLKYDKPETSNNLYKELLEFCPIGIFKINMSGEIIEMNEFGANLLSVVQIKGNLNIHTFLSEESDIDFENLLVKARLEKEKCSMIIDLVLKEYSAIRCIVSVLFSENENLFLLGMIDISEQTSLEGNLSKKSEKLEWMNEMLISREIRMVELKKEVNHLLEKLGEQGKYDFK